MPGKIFNIQKFSTSDGEGIRTVFFFKGCPLRCVWCHNPESQSFEEQISYNPAKCISCGMCREVCRNGCHKILDSKHIFNRKNCLKCGKCARICPSAALEITGRNYTVTELVKKAEEDAEFYSDGGGVTLSGGEPFAQGGFALEFLKALKSKGLNTAVETCGYCNAEVIEAAIPYVDTFLFDCKAPDDLHERFTGVKRDLIKRNMSVLASNNAKIVLRCPIIGGCNDIIRHYDNISVTATEIKAAHIELLPYHKLGVSKARFWDIKCAESFTVPTEEDMKKTASYIEGKSKICVRIMK